MAMPPIPWDVLIREGLRLVESARQAKAERTKEQATTASAEAQDSIGAVRRRLDDVEAQNRRDAEMSERIAEQVRLLSAAADQLRTRCRLALWLAGGALAIAAGVAFALLATV